MVVVSASVNVGPISETLDADGHPTGDTGRYLEKGFAKVAGDLAWWTEAAKAQRAKRAPPY